MEKMVVSCASTNIIQIIWFITKDTGPIVDVIFSISISMHYYKYQVQLWAKLNIDECPTTADPLGHMHLFIPTTTI